MNLKDSRCRKELKKRHQQDLTLIKRIKQRKMYTKGSVEPLESILLDPDH